MQIRPGTNADHDAIWNIFHEIVVAGDTYAFDPNMSREEALAYWFRDDTHTYVAEKNGGIVGTYIRQRRFYGCIRRTELGSGTQNGRALFERGTPDGFSRYAIQFRGLDEYRSNSSLETARLQNRRRSARRVSAS